MTKQSLINRFILLNLASYALLLKENMREKVLKIWPEINWIENKELREKVLNCWVYAIENSVLSPEDLEVIPFSLLIKDCKITFMNHKRTAVQLSVDIAKRMKENFGNEIKIDMDLLIAGAILIDIGKLIEYDKVDGKLVTSKAGHLLASSIQWSFNCR